MPKMAQHTGKWLLKAPCQPVLIKISISCFTIVWVKIPRRWKKAKMWRFLVFSTEPLTSWTFYLLFMMIIDLKQSIDLRWLFDSVLLFILRWSYFHKSWEKVEKDFQMTKKLTQGALCCWGDGQPRLVDVQLPEVENGRLVGSGLVLVAQPGQPAASWSCWSHFGWLSLEPATAAGGLRQLAEPLSMQQLQSQTHLFHGGF